MKVPVRRIVRAVGDAAARWADADFPPRVRLLEAIVARTGYSVPVVEYALDRLFGAIDASALENVIAGELGSLDVLDDFVERSPGIRTRALPVGRVAVLSSRTTIGVALLPALFALCAKNDVLVKDREDALVAAFFASLGEELDEFAGAAAARAWDGAAASETELRGAGAVVAFGSDETLAAIARLVAPPVRFIGFGSKASVGYVGREALAGDAAARALADAAARDVVLYDGEGCLSLHALFVERGGAIEPAAFAAALAKAVERAAVEFPPSSPDTARSARVAAARDLAAFRAATGSGAVFSDAAASYLVTYDPPESEPPGFLPRAIAVRPVDGPSGAAAYLQRHRVPLEALAAAPVRPDVAAMAVQRGAARIAAFGTLQAPPLGNRHGGRPRIAEFVRWIGEES